MLVDDAAFAADVLAKFHKTMYVSGWFYHALDPLEAVELAGSGILGQTAAVGLPHPHVSLPYGSGAGFRLQCLRESDDDPDDFAITFRLQSGRTISATLLDLAHERLVESTTTALYHRFKAALSEIRRPTIVDVGGRDRSDFDRRHDFPDAEYVVVDVLPGANVDIVADAHELSRVMAPESADAVIAVATFEHLLMPWKAIVEINRVLKPGGLVCIVTHQTLALHDMPWDFWRLSADAWDGLLNTFTGFEIVERAQSREQFVIPYLYHPAKRDAEQAAGFELTGVIARKCGPPRVDWPVPLSEVIVTRYPTDGAPEHARRKRRGRAVRG
jgi:SAM-dependent methyltransferase